MSMQDDNDRLWRGLRRAFRLPFSRSRLDAEIDAELRFHLEGRIDDLMQREGLSRAAAEAEARRRFGDFARYRRAARDIDQSTHHRRNRMEIRETFARETARAARSLRRTPTFSLIAIVTLALGIGAATAIFTLLDAVVLRPLPYASADRLVSLSSPVPLMQGQTVWGLARHEMFYFLEQGRTLENLAVYRTSSASVIGEQGGERTMRVRRALTSASLFDVLGFRLAAGRAILRPDNSERAPRIVVLSHDYWASRFGSDPAAIGKTLNVDGQTVEIVGVLARGAGLPDLRVDLWMPAHVDSTTVQNNHTWNAIGRLRAGFTAADAERELAPLTARMPEVFPNVYSPNFMKNTGFTTKVVSLRDEVVGDIVTRALWALFGAVALVLLIAAANVANLYLVRMDARRRDVAMRTALGAGRRHLATQYLAESLLLTGVAGVMALGLAQAMLRIMVRIAPSELPRLSEVALRGSGVAFAVLVAIAAGLVFGLLPLASWKVDVAALRDGGRGMTSSRRRMAARRTLVAAQMAFAVVLLASASLMIRTYRNLHAIQPGFESDGILTMEIALPNSRYGRTGDAYAESANMAANFHAQLADRVQSLPGVVRAGMTERLPLVSGDWCIGVTLEGPTPEQARGACPSSTIVAPGYFEALGIRVEGTSLSWAGVNAQDGGIVVSRSFAQHHWPDEDPIGKGMRYWGASPPFYRVVGIADDVHANGLDAAPTEVVYFPVRPIPDAPLWFPATFMHLVVRTNLPDPSVLTGTITRMVEELEPQAAVANAQTMETIVAKSIARRSFTMVLLGIAAGIALLLSAVGIYGVISYIVTQRRSEIGVRMALGAQVQDVTRMVLSQSLGLAFVGVLVGVGAALATTRVLDALLYGVTPNDPVTLVLVPVTLLGVALAATYAPARRAARTDPVEALRSD